MAFIAMPAAPLVMIHQAPGAAVATAAVLAIATVASRIQPRYQWVHPRRQ